MRHSRHALSSDQSGYSLLELLFATALLLMVSSGTLDGILRLTKTSATIANRSQMHSGVRNATELLQQEVGQAGRIAFSHTFRLGDWAPAGNATVPIQALDSAGNVLTSVNPVDGMFVGEQIVVGTGAHEETVTITAVYPTVRRISANFVESHGQYSPVAVYGGFASGVVPTTMTNGSSGTVLKIYGDINSNGQMQYVEYTCDLGSGNLYRRAIAYTATTKPTLNASQALLNNVLANPDGTACFTYQQRTVNGTTFVVDVAITLTVETEDPDAVTGLHQRETKALLNVAPRNVFNVWQLAGLGIATRVQPMPASVQTLIGLP